MCPNPLSVKSASDLYRLSAKCLYAQRTHSELKNGPGLMGMYPLITLFFIFFIFYVLYIGFVSIVNKLTQHWCAWIMPCVCVWIPPRLIGMSLCALE